METFTKIITSRVTPLGAVAACIYAVWQIADSSGNSNLGYSLVLIAIIGLIGHFWLRISEQKDKTKQNEVNINGNVSKKRIRLAILPLIPNPENDQITALGDAISGSVIRSLAQVNDLEVIEERSILQLPNYNNSFEKIKQSLDGLDYIVVGTLLRDGQNCSVTAKIYRVKDNTIISMLEKQVPYNLLNQIPTSISKRILDALNIQIGNEGKKRGVQMSVLQASTEIAEAFETYSAGKFNLKYYNINRKKENFNAAEQYLRQAITIDSKYTDAYSAMGFLYIIAWETEGAAEFLNKSARYFKNVLKIDENYRTAQAEIGYINFLQGKIVEGVSMVQKAINESNPQAIPFNVLSLLYQYLGFWEESIRLTRLVNIIDQLYTYPYTNAALSCQLLGLYNESIKWSEKAAQKGPGGFTSALMKGAAHFRNNRPDMALASWDQGRNNASDHEKFLFDIVSAWVSATQGDLKVAQDVINHDSFQIWITGAYAPFAISLLALAGEHKYCLSLLEKEKTYMRSYRYLTTDQTLRSLYPNPQFQTLIQKRYIVWLEHLDLWQNKLINKPTEVVKPAELQ